MNNDFNTADIFSGILYFCCGFHPDAMAADAGPDFKTARHFHLAACPPQALALGPKRISGLFDGHLRLIGRIHIPEGINQDGKLKSSQLEMRCWKRKT